MNNNVMIGGISAAKSWKDAINPLLKKFDKDTKKIFSDFDKEIKSKKNNFFSRIKQNLEF